MFLLLSTLVLLTFCFVLGVTITLSKSLSGAVNASQTTDLTDETAVIGNTTLPQAWGGGLSTRTDNNTGVVTMTDPAHAITTGMRVDVYWDGGSRYGMTVGTVAGVTVPIDLGGGDNLPIAATTVVVSPAVTMTFGVTGNNMTALVMAAPQAKGLFAFDVGGTDSFAVTLQQGDVYDWSSHSNSANPFAGLVITGMHQSSSDTTKATTDHVAAALLH